MAEERSAEVKESGPSAATIGATIAIVALIAFIIANTKKTEVNFLFFKADNVSVWWVIVLSAIITLIGERLAGFAWRRHKAKKHKQD
jgi:uncharacterized integral membrane protein